MNADALRRQGVAYPHDGGGHPGNAADIADLTSAGVLDLFGDARTLVLSHEDLLAHAARHAGLAATLHDLNVRVRVVAFLRPFSEFAFGDYSQHMKQRFQEFLAERQAYGGLDFDAFAARRAAAFQPARNIAEWAALFPGRPPVLAPHRSIARTMARLLPGVRIDWNVPHDQANPSLHVADCDTLAAAIRDPSITAASVQRKFMRAWLRAHKEARRQPDPGRSPERVAMLESLFAPQNAALSARFGYDNTLPARPQPVPDAEGVSRSV